MADFLVKCFKPERESQTICKRRNCKFNHAAVATTIAEIGCSRLVVACQRLAFTEQNAQVSALCGKLMARTSIDSALPDRRDPDFSGWRGPDKSVVPDWCRGASGCTTPTQAGSDIAQTQVCFMADPMPDTPSALMPEPLAVRSRIKP